MSNEPIDVLAVLDRAARRATDERDQHDDNNAKAFADSWEALRAELRNASAAIAELIDAANTVYRLHLNCETNRHAITNAYSDLSAALARATGEGVV